MPRSTQCIGRATEACSSLELYQNAYGVLLICPQILRSRGCGQVDLASFSSDGEVTLWEVKSITRYHDAGWMELIKKNQLTRLRRSIEFLSQVLENSVNIRIIGVGKTGKKRFLL